MQLRRSLLLLLVAMVAVVEGRMKRRRSLRPNVDQSVKPTSFSVQTVQSFRKTALDVHNECRSKVALGRAPNKNGTVLPTAANMYKLTYSKMVESYAKQTAATCEWKHTRINGTSNNLYVSGTTGPFEDPEVALKKAMKAWYDELKDDGLQNIRAGRSDMSHFTEMVWSNVREIGCGVQFCDSMTGISFGANFKYTFIVCDYSPSGNYYDTEIYSVGTPCSACDSYPNSECSAGDGLCTIRGVEEIHD